MRTCAISFKECWQDGAGVWYSDGGFPLQMTALGSMFDSMAIVIVAVPPRPGGLPLPRGARIVPLRRPSGHDFRRKLSVVSHLPYFLRIISREVRQCDVVQIPVPGDIPLLGLLVAALFRKRLVVRYEGSWQRNSQTTMMNRVTRAIIRLLAGGRNVVIATGEGDKPPAKHIRWLFATVLTDRELKRIVPVTRPGLLDPPELVYVGRLSPEKGVHNLIQAVAILREERFSVVPKLTIIGDGPSRMELEAEAARMRCSDLIRFTGQLNRTRLSEELLKADLGALPSLSEGYPKALLDLMAHGLPAIASDVGAARQIVGSDGERGWVVRPGDARALANAIYGALTSPSDWAVLRRRCRAYAEERTLECWSGQIAQTCAKEWGIPLSAGQIRSEYTGA